MKLGNHPAIEALTDAIGEAETIAGAVIAVRERVKDLVHENARLREALRLQDPRNATERYELIADAFTAKTGHPAPGRSMPAAMAYLPDDDDARQRLWRTFCNEWHESFFDTALAEEGT